MAGRLQAAGAGVVVLGRPRASIFQPRVFLAGVVGTICDIMRLCSRVRPDVIHCHLTDASLFGIVASLFFPEAKLVITKHTPVLLPDRSRLDLRNLLRKGALWLAYRRATAVIAVSVETREALLRCYHLSPDRVVTIPNGVPIPSPGQYPRKECRTAFGLGPQDVLVVNVGRMVAVKGQMHLLEAMARLSQSPRRFVLLIAGEGPCRESLSRRIRESGLGDRVRLLGDRDDVAALYAAADIAVSASLSEGTSLAIIEAMAAGKPIVATAVDGNRDLLAHGVSALLVPAADPDALAAALDSLARNSQLAERLGAAARRKAEAEFAVTRVVESYAAVWLG